MLSNSITTLEALWANTLTSNSIRPVTEVSLGALKAAPEAFSFRLDNKANYVINEHCRSSQELLGALKPLTVFCIAGDYYILDGHQRYQALINAIPEDQHDYLMVPVVLFRGTFKEARYKAVVCNLDGANALNSKELEEAAWSFLLHGTGAWGEQAEVWRITRLDKNKASKMHLLQTAMRGLGIDLMDYTLEEARRLESRSYVLDEDKRQGDIMKVVGGLNFLLSEYVKAAPELLADALSLVLDEEQTAKLTSRLDSKIGVGMARGEYQLTMEF